MDTINGLLGLVIAATLSLNVLTLYRDKQVLGVSGWPSALFAVFDAFQAVQYAQMGHPISSAAFALLTAVSLTWLGQMIYYNRKNHGPNPNPYSKQSAVERGVL